MIRSNEGEDADRRPRNWMGSPSAGQVGGTAIEFFPRSNGRPRTFARFRARSHKDLPGISWRRRLRYPRIYAALHSRQISRLLGLPWRGQQGKRSTLRFITKPPFSSRWCYIAMLVLIINK